VEHRGDRRAVPWLAVTGYHRLPRAVFQGDIGGGGKNAVIPRTPRVTRPTRAPPKTAGVGAGDRTPPPASPPSPPGPLPFRQPQRLVGYRLQPETVPSGIQQPSLASEQLKVPREGPRLPRQLLSRRRGGTVVGPRKRLEDHPITLADGSNGNQHVVEDRIGR